MSQPSVGLIGLGLLGAALAERLLAAGFLVDGYDLDADRCAGLTRLGGRSAGSVAELLACDRLILCLPDSTIVAAVIDELMPRFRPGRILIDTTTGHPDDAARQAMRLRSLGVLYGEATILGSSEVARRGEAVAMLGGDNEWLTAIHDLLPALARRWFHVGAAGSGARMKLVVNLVLGLHRAVLAEGLTLAAAFELDLERTLEVLQSGAAASRVMDSKGAKMLHRDYRPEARLSQHLKDVRLILAEAARRNAPTPLSALHARLLETAESLGYGDADNAAILEAFEKSTSE